MLGLGGGWYWQVALFVTFEQTLMSTPLRSSYIHISGCRNISKLFKLKLEDKSWISNAEYYINLSLTLKNKGSFDCNAIKSFFISSQQFLETNAILIIKNTFVHYKDSFVEWKDFMNVKGLSRKPSMPARKSVFLRGVQGSVAVISSSLCSVSSSLWCISSSCLCSACKVLLRMQRLSLCCCLSASYVPWLPLAYWKCYIFLKHV